MQEATITDVDGVKREYAFDTYDGRLYVKDARAHPGRPYRPIYKAKKADIFALGGAHAEMWSDQKVARAALLSDNATPSSYRGRY